jgi:hypothetical protein
MCGHIDQRLEATTAFAIIVAELAKAGTQGRVTTPGKPIAVLTVDGANNLPVAEPKPTGPAAWSDIPQPATRLGREVRSKLEHALVSADVQAARWAQAVGQQLHPAERSIAVRAVLRCWHQQLPH